MSTRQETGRINTNVLLALALGLIALSVFISSFWLI